MKLTVAIGALLVLVCPAPALAQDGARAGPSVAFAPVTQIPIPLQSTSGRFSSLNPINRRSCFNKKVIGRVVSTHLIMVKEKFCGHGQSGNVLVNVDFSNPADVGQMIVGRRVAVTATFKNAEEGRTSEIYADYLIAEKATLVVVDPRASPAPAFTSYMICQPPELDALAMQLGRELCVQSTIVANLTDAGPALETAARASAKAPPTDELSGDPEAITCRLDVERSDIHLPAMACAHNNYWRWWAVTQVSPIGYSQPAPP